jgi:hypothetical protein
VLLREAAVLNTGGGLDGNGNPIPAVNTPIRAEFAPLTAEESFSAGRNPSSVSYRMTFLWPTVLPTSTTVTWRTKVYNFVGPSMQHTIQGRLHHQEAIVTRATG